MQDSLKRFANLSPEQRKLVLKKLRQQELILAPDQAQAPPLAPASREGDLPLSFAQQRLWFLNQLEPGSPVYNFPPIGVRLSGRLDVMALKQSLDKIVQRHEVLRTTFATVDGRPIQVIDPAATAALSIVDLQQVTVDQQAYVHQLVSTEAQRPFDLQHGPLLRVILLRLTREEHILLPIMHHIISDLWSLGILIRELATFYQALSTGGDGSPPTGAPQSLPELPVQYADFAMWQRQWLQGQVLEKHLTYWKQQLEGAPAILELPTDRPRPPMQTFRGAKHIFTLPGDLTEALKTLSQHEGATLFMTLLAAFQTLLYRYTGQPDIVLGSPIANRNWSEIEGLMGSFVNILALRTDLHGVGHPSFHELLKRVREVTVGAYAHQDLPFEKLVEELQPERSLSHSPIFQVMFVLQNVQNIQSMLQKPLTLPGLTLSSLEFDSGIARFDLSLSMIEIQPGLLGVFEYNTDLFDAATITRMEGHFRTLLEGIVARDGAGRRLSDLPLLTEAERRQLLVGWNDTRTPYQDTTIHELFEAQAEQTPDAVAVVFSSTESEEGGDEQLTYGELNRRANQLAHHLQSLGVGPEALVGLCVERSLEMVVGLLGILKAGGAYVPLDPAYPPERLAFIVQDARARVLLTQEQWLEQLPADKTLVVRLDADRDAIAQRDDANPDSPVTPENLAYVIYTSGSTGTPKGVQISHGAVLNFLCSMQREPGLTPGDALLAVTSLSFDIAGLEMYLPLVTGARLEVASRSMASDGDQLRQRLASSGITVMQATPATWRLLLAAGWSASPAFKALCGGEALPQDLAHQLLDAHVTLWNLYGPTETTIWSTLCKIESKAGEPSIGRPIANTQIYLLDAALNPTPIGVPGELYIGGAGLACGYLDRPDLTAERFVPDPFGGEPGGRPSNGGLRLYRTGDLARYRPDGKIEFLGRLDHQVKVRGFRIELGEIEAVLEQHPAVQEAVVVARDMARGAEHGAVENLRSPGEDPRPPVGDLRLVAYLVPHAGHPLALDDLQRSLRAKLPDYMIPSAFVMLAEGLPRTPNGKVDRRALSDPGRTPDPIRLEPEEIFVAARTPVEEVLAGIWAEVLGLEQVGVRDDFFELGGHSLLANQVAARVREAFQVELPLRALFERPTVAGLAASIAELKGQAHSEPAPSLPALVPAPNERCQPFPLTDVQQAYWIGRRHDFELGNVATHIYLEVESGGLDVARLEQAWQRLIARHDMLRAIVRPDGQQQILDPVPPYHIEVLDLRGQASEKVAAQLEEVRQRLSHQVLPSDQWPLFEIRASRLDDQRLRLHVSLDVLIGDAWSWQILNRELALLYQNPDAHLAPLELSFRDYVLAECGIRSSELYRRSLEYWRSRVPTLPPAPELPLATSPSTLSHPRFVRRRARLEREEWRQLKSRATRAGLTPSGVLLAAFAEVLTAWSKNPRFTLNLTLFHRLPLHPQVNEIVGDFTSLTLLEVDHSRPESFEARARRLQGTLWQDLDHGYMNGVQVLRELAQAAGGTPRVAMPVVFTSTLVQTPQGAPVVGLWSSTHSKIVYSITQTPQVWLDHQVSEQEEALSYDWDAVEKLFPEGLLDDMFEAYGHRLHCLAKEQAAWQEAERCLTPAAQLEQRALVNATQSPRSDEMLHTLFAAQVKQRPGQAAVITSHRTLTYQELDRLSNQVGHGLRERGARPNTLVAVVMEKGWEQVVAVLGVLRSGAAYLPIDPALPQERVWYLMEHGQVQSALTQPWLDDKLAWPEGVQRLRVEWDGLEGLDDQPLSPAQTPQDLAYVIFTSGSTGLPKGVMIDHRGAVNTILDINQRFSVTPNDRVLALSALNFDLSVYDIFGLLAAGGGIVIPGAEARRDPAHWLELIQRERVTLWDSVPALMEMLVEYAAGRSERLPGSLRLVFMSGDWIPVTLPDRIKALAESVEIFSGGGATEASIWSILYPIGEVDPAWTSIPYGKPMVNQSFHVLDDHLEPRPVWVPGQLYIGGIGLAKGYWRDEAKTQASFIVHPRTRERLYRTGDLGRYLPDGNIEFLGREDFQVKIRGHRIELGEIEAALLQHPAVQTGVVTAVGDPRSDKRLVGYVVLNREAASALESPGGPLLQDYEPPQAKSLLLDPIERLKFKLAHHGLRRDNGNRPCVQLIQPELDETLIETYVTRRSYRKFKPGPITFEQLSRLLSCLWMIDLEGAPLPKARYGSAGSLYPVQTYLCVRPGQVEGLAGGAYYYHPREHRLILLSAEAHLEPRLYPAANRAVFDASAFALFFVGQLDAITPLYGEWARDFSMLEAGLMTHLLETTAPACEIGLCQIGGLEFDSIRHWFALGESHVYLHSLLGGRIDAHQATLAAFLQDSGEVEPFLQLVQQAPKQDEALPWQSAPLHAASRVPVQSNDAIVQELGSFMRSKLPDYMLPSTFVLLESLPLTPNGKVDRCALPTPDAAAQPEEKKAFVAPQTELEQAITAVWQEVLQVEKIGVYDSFFDLGGNSVHVIRAHSKLRDVLGQELPLVKLFECPTIHSLAEHLAREQDRPFSFQPSDDRADARRASRRRRTRTRQRPVSSDEKEDSE